MGHYETLGIRKDSDANAIRKAYRNLAMKYHPDKNIGNEASAAKKFKEISAAFEVLSDSLKRSDYDRKINSRSHPGWTPPKPEPPPPPKDKTDTLDLSKIHVDVLPVKGRGNDILMDVFLDANEMRAGCRKVVTIKRHRMCRRCVADGNVMVRCPKCAANQHFAGHCMRCEGYGAIEETCGNCKGKGIESNWESHEFMATFPVCNAGHIVTIIGEGESGLGGQLPGNVRLVVKIAKN